MKTAACLLLLPVALAAAPAHGEDAARPLTGDVEVGYRDVSVDGNESKYREDVNLPDNAFRLFLFDLDWQPEGSKWLDSLVVEAEGLGGEPYASAGLTLRKTGLYDFKARYRSSDYFYQDSGYFFREGGDIHTWNAKRTFYNAEFALQAADWVTVRLGADRLDREGSSTTSRELQRDVFELRRPVDQTASSVWLGADFRAGWANVTVEQRMASYENRWLMTSGRSQGEEPGPAELDTYSQLQVQDADAPVSRLVASGRPLDWLSFVVDYAHVGAETDFDVEGSWAGTDYDDSPGGNPPGPYSTTLANTGTVDRTSDLWSAEITFSVLKSLDLTAEISSSSYDQDGDLDLVEVQDGGNDAGSARVAGQVENSLTLTAYGLKADWRPVASLALFAGVGWQDREADFQLAGPEVKTTRTLYRAGLAWRPTRVWDFRVAAERATDDDPYTPVSPTDIDRLRADVRIRPLKTLGFSLRFKDETRENTLSYTLGQPTDDTPPADEIATAQFDVTSWGATVDWSPGGRVVLAAGYDRTEIDSNADIVYLTSYTFAPVFDVFTRLDQTGYVSDQDTIYVDVRLDFGKGWSAGLGITTVDNTGTFPLDWDRYDTEVRYEFAGGWHLRAAWDRYDLDEENPYAGPPSSPAPDINDYTADLFTLALGYRY